MVSVTGCLSRVGLRQSSVSCPHGAVARRGALAAAKHQAERLSKELDELTAKSTEDAGKIEDLSKELRPA